MSPQSKRTAAGTPLGRKLLWASLALAPITFVVDFAFHPGDVALFVLAATSLVPLAWLIGESTEHAAEHTGPGIGGFLNASFGNAPELIIATFAVADGLPNVVRGSLAGSVISNLLLVLGVAMATGETGRPINRNSLLLQLGLVGTAVLLFLAPSIAGWHGNPERHSLAVLTAPLAAILLVLYVVAQTIQLRGFRKRQPCFEVKKSGFGGIVQPFDMFVIAGIEFNYLGGKQHWALPVWQRMLAK